nr:immunoglobulin heavy chain junction region [Macaca mulatta]MOX92879.1 immunoglobulin heavy chain junction region [Macaca mulatta]MOX92942.1 immunoglobulin heavy chain junction region [Macaca mulatta]MOX96095.1 immunoglobulin heavy chain junction region [Macaca mulatta]MOX96205.1 immunoglobulin heavy chain junction region [Macaca mulatta]
CASCLLDTEGTVPTWYFDIW